MDDTGDIDVYMRKNFIPGEDEVSILYEDGSCHGTSVADVIAALDNGEGITGINPQVLLYSARVLDSENRAPVSRVVEAIDWAISQDVDIINLSFGTTVDSPALRAAIQRAYNANILLVAAAGNCGGVCTVGGTSLAAPHVTAIASVLWQQDKSMPADFIRALLDFSANQYGDALEYGYGLVAEGIGAGILEYNEKPVMEFEDATYVEGLWLHTSSKYGGHQLLLQQTDKENAPDLQGIDGETMTTSGMKILKAAAIAPDNYFLEMRVDPEWHGYSGRTDSDKGDDLIYHSNYVFAYIFITQIASAVYGGELPKNVAVPAGMSCISGCSFSANCVDKMAANIKETFDEAGNLKNKKNNTILDWSKLISGEVTNRTKAIYIYGLALHSVTDAFAHSSYTLDGKHIGHITGTAGGADDKNKVPNRYECARAMCRYIISHVKKFESGSFEDFNGVFSGTYDNSFKLKRLNKYIEAVDSENYKKHDELYDAATQN